MFETAQTRNELVIRLIKALEHIPIERQISIITSFFSIKELEKIVKFQERD